MMLEAAAPSPETREPQKLTPDAPVSAPVMTRPLEVTSARVVPTLEHLLYGVALLVALGARLVGLGAAGLSPLEAASSWQAWLDAMALQVANAPQSTSALLHAMQTGLFWLAGGGGDETLARLPVALMGATMAALPWFWRARLGRGAALLLAFLLALDPWLVALSRSAQSAALSATLALLALTALHVATAAWRARAVANTEPTENPDETQQASEEEAPTTSPVTGSLAGAIASLALGLLLVSGTQAWSWLVVLLLYVVVEGPNAIRPLFTVRNGLLFGAAALLGATGWFSHPQELRMVSASLGAWLTRFDVSVYSFFWPWLRLVADQPFVLLFGAIGIVSLWRADKSDVSRARLFLTLWLGWGVVLMLLPGRNPAELPLLGVPLAIFAVRGIMRLARAARAFPHPEDWRDAAVLGVVLMILVASLAFWLTALVWSQIWPTFEATVVFGLLLLCAALVVGFSAFTSGRQAMLVALGVAGIFLFGLSLSAAYNLASAPQPRHPTGFTAVAAHPDARALTQDVLALSSRRVGDAMQHPVLVVNDVTQRPDPQIGWLLRHMRNLAFADSTRVANTYDAARPPLVVTTGAAADTIWNENYIGTSYNLRTHWLPALLPPLTGHPDWATFWSAAGRPWMRWLLFHEAPSPQPDAVILWATP